MTPAEQKAMNVDEKIEIIRKALEGKHGYCSVNRGPVNATFYYGKSKADRFNKEKISVPKEFIEALPLVDKKEK